MNNIRLGLGLLSIGRTWGAQQTPPPKKQRSIELIEMAVQEGISFFDTAPAYADSECILGELLHTKPELLKHCTIATKAGEHWDELSQNTFVNHRYEMMCRSLDVSLERLGRIDVLQIHKATKDVIESPELERVIAYAQNCGIKSFGLSISDQAALQAACRLGAIQWLQFPLNKEMQQFKNIGDKLKENKMTAIVNRPFAMGELARSEEARRLAFKFLFSLNLPPNSVILTGTASQQHLKENIYCFERELS